MKFYEVKFSKKIGSGYFTGVTIDQNAKDAAASVFKKLSIEYGSLFTDATTGGLVTVEEITAERFYVQTALCYAEKIGIYHFEVRGSKIIYISYYGSEGFYKVTRDLLSGKETRKHQASTKKKYNYFCG